MSRPTPRRPGQSDDPPESVLDYRHGIVQAQSEDEFLANNNLGLGVYGTREYWQQIENFSQMLYAEAAFEDNLMQRAEYKAKGAIAERGFSYEIETDEGTVRHEIEAWDELDDAERKDHATDETDWESREFEAYIDEEWNALSATARLAAIQRFTEYDPGRHLPQARILLARHEMSRSKDGRLVDAAMVDSHRIEEVDGRPQGPVTK